MSKTKKKLEKLKKEKEKLKQMSEKVKSQKKEKKKFSLKNIFKNPFKEKKKHRRTSYEQRKRFSKFISKAGVESDFSDINKKIMIATGIPVTVATLYLIVDFIIKGTFLSDAFLLLAQLWIFGSLALYFIIWTLFFIYVDFKIVQRKKEIERVFPDFLQLTAANINAGMPIDRALWFAIRPRFGILANEMESVAKATMVGENLSHALIDFADKYDSLTVKRSINLLLEGLESGGEIGDLLVKVANNIRDTEIIRKEMASSVTTYVIFILFATLGAAPFLFGLTTELIVIMQTIIGDINIGQNMQSFGGISSMLATSGESISLTDYKIFAIANICMSSIFASILISVIEKGNATEAIKKAPLYIVIGLVNYLIAFTLLNYFLGGFVL